VGAAIAAGSQEEKGKIADFVKEAIISKDIKTRETEGSKLIADSWKYKLLGKLRKKARIQQIMIPSPRRFVRTVISPE
jgi:hypothetical protein